MAIRKVNLPLNTRFPPIWPEAHGGESYFDFTDQDRNIPRIIWAENVLPTVDGIASVVKTPYITDDSPVSLDQATDQLRLYTVYDGQGNATYYYYANGDHIVFNLTSSEWEVLRSISPTVLPATIIYLRGISYVLEPGGLVYRFSTNFASMVLEPVTGIDPTLVDGTTSALDYALAWTQDTIYWSAPGVPNEFTPVLSNVLTGAGSANILELLGQIISCHRINNGFIIYGTQNIISARYSGNARNPWIFKGLEGSAGISRRDAVYASDSSSTHFVWTEEGIKAVDLAKCTNVFPEVTRFLRGYSYYSSNYDGTFTQEISTYDSGVPCSLAVKCSFVGDQFFCISYGKRFSTYFEYLLVFDVFLEKWGHIKIQHIDVFEFIDIKNYGVTAEVNFTGELGIGLLAVMEIEGEITVVQPHSVPLPDEIDEDTLGEFVIAGYKMSPDRHLIGNQIEFFGNMYQDTTVGLSGITGSSPSTEIPFVQSGAAGKENEFLGYCSGESLQIRIRGRFDLTSSKLSLANRGKR